MAKLEPLGDDGTCEGLPITDLPLELGEVGPHETKPIIDVEDNLRHELRPEAKPNIQNPNPRLSAVTKTAVTAQTAGSTPVPLNDSADTCQDKDAHTDTHTDTHTRTHAHARTHACTRTHARMHRPTVLK